MNIPQEIMDKIDVIAGSAYIPQDREWIIGYVMQGYYLRDEEVDKLKAEITFTRDVVLKAYFKNELVQQLQQKEQELQEIKDERDTYIKLLESCRSDFKIGCEHLKQKENRIKELEELLDFG